MSMRIAAALLALGLSACSTTAPLIMANQAMTRPMNDQPERYILAGVDNPEATPAGQAGSSPKGYDGLSVYGPTAKAQQLLRGIERDYGLREVTAWPIQPLHMHCAVLEVLNPAERAAVIAALTRDRRVRVAQPMQTFTTQTTVYNDPYLDLQRGFRLMNLSEAHQLTRGEGIRIAIVDTGVDTNHPDLRGVVVQSVNYVDADAAQFKRDRHGTELAGIIAAVANNGEGIVGIAPGARLSVFKACWQLQEDADAARCNSFTLLRALTAALESHAQVINLSIAGPPDPLLRQLIHEGLNRGIVFVAAAPAAGTAPDADLFGLDGVITVANGGVQGVLGTPLHAPGREILTLLPGGHYDFASGTSIATAQVTGTVALMLAADPKLTAREAYRLLRDSTVHAENSGVEESIDACAAIVALLGRGACLQSEIAASRVAMH